MSRIGKKPIEVPSGVIVSVDPGRVTVSGPKGELRQVVPTRMTIVEDEGAILVTRPTERGEREAPAALDDLGDAVDLDDPLLELSRFLHVNCH